MMHATPVMRIAAFASFLAALTVPASCGSGTNAPEPAITVSAAASLADVLAETADSFSVRYRTGVRINTASSGTLARQIVQGAVPDVYVSASPRWAAYVDSLGHFLKGFSAEIAWNALVLVAPAESGLRPVAVDSTLDFAALLKDGRLSVGDPAHVPAGGYALQALAYFGWYGAVRARLLPARDVRSALMNVELGEAPAGIVYLTDARRSGRVTLLGRFPAASHDRIAYVAGVCRDRGPAREFFAYLRSDAAGRIWARHGFGVPGAVKEGNP